MFDYKQRPFNRSLTNEDYDRATGRLAAALPKLTILLGSSPTPPPQTEGNFLPGHECNGTLKTFAAEHCPFCRRVK